MEGSKERKEYKRMQRLLNDIGKEKGKRGWKNKGKRKRLCVRGKEENAGGCVEREWEREHERRG